MPNCFQLTKRGETGPSKLIDIDNAMCLHFGVPVHPKLYHAWWFDHIGFLLSCGYSFDYIKHNMKDKIWKYKIIKDDEAVKDYEHLLDITIWLDENYTPDSWVQIGK